MELWYFECGEDYEAPDLKLVFTSANAAWSFWGNSGFPTNEVYFEKNGWWFQLKKYENANPRTLKDVLDIEENAKRLTQRDATEIRKAVGLIMQSEFAKEGF